MLKDSYLIPDQQNITTSKQADIRCSWTKIFKWESLHTFKSGLWTTRKKNAKTHSPCPYLVMQALPTLPLEYTVFLQMSTDPSDWRVNTDLCWKECGMTVFLWDDSFINSMNWNQKAPNNLSSRLAVWNFIFGKYKKYFCGQINIIHTASNHKTNTVC